MGHKLSEKTKQKISDKLNNNKNAMKHSIDMKNNVISMRNDGISLGMISKHFNIPKGTVWTWCRNMKKHKKNKSLTKNFL